MYLTKTETRDLYRDRAPRYDLATWVYRLLGVRLDHYRNRAVQSLDLPTGQTVVDLGCGTGLNLSRLVHAVGPSGRVIGVDLTDAMLQKAEQRVRQAGWRNVELVQSDMADYDFPDGIGGVLSTFAITLVPEFDTIIESAAAALESGGRIAIFDMKEPDHWPEWLIRLAVRLNQPYGVSLELADRHPWESVSQHLEEVEYQEFYLGALYLSVGQAPGRQM